MRGRRETVVHVEKKRLPLLRVNGFRCDLCRVNRGAVWIDNFYACMGCRREYMREISREAITWKDGNPND
jgi:hypothetical protein